MGQVQPPRPAQCVAVPRQRTFSTNIGSPLPGAARLEHKPICFQGGSTLNPNIKRNRNRATKASMEPVDESEEASAMARRRGPHHP